MTTKSALNLDPATYVRHALHGENAQWREKNCYVDVWIEVIHAQGLDPVPCLAPAIAADFETDQWTFFKPAHADLEALYGIDVQELQIWRPLIDHTVTQVGAGRLVCTEADSFFLPDTQGTDYRTNHVKSTIAIASIDVEARKLGYFHNTWYYSLEGDDFDGTFRTKVAPDRTFLPLYCEFAKLERARVKPAAEMAAYSIERLKSALRRRPATNPLTKFRERFPRDVEWLQKEGLALYHGYAFASLRQCGVGFDCAAQYLGWLAKHAGVKTEEAAAAFDEVSAGAKALVLKTARAVNGKKTVDFGPLFEPMEASWARGMELVIAAVGGA